MNSAPLSQFLNWSSSQCPRQPHSAKQTQPSIPFVAHNELSRHTTSEKAYYCHGQCQRPWWTSPLFCENSLKNKLKKEDTTHPPLHKKSNQAYQVLPMMWQASTLRQNRHQRAMGGSRGQWQMMLVSCHLVVQCCMLCAVVGVFTFIRLLRTKMWDFL